MKVLALGVFFFAVMLPCVFAQSADMQPLVRIKLNASKPETIFLKELKNRVETYQRQMNTTVSSVDDRKQ
ncbi:MAG: peptidyl-prolyl cis-trans isomerase, partial [Spirochaetaceae bacterium]|nr:peptidyl-prolyl cis-trans isomerase [Spirochaetaceae bacterium]